MSRNKYRAKPIVIDGIRFASQGEGRRYVELRTLQKAGLISKLELQPVYKLYCGVTPITYESGRHAKYIADFRYMDIDRGMVIEDFKGMDTDLSKLKRAMVKAHYGITIEIVK
jgi:hypothetical protein